MCENSCVVTFASRDQTRMNPIVLITIFAVLIPQVLGNSCMQVKSLSFSDDSVIQASYRYCEPPPSDKDQCK